MSCRVLPKKTISLILVLLLVCILTLLPALPMSEASTQESPSVLPPAPLTISPTSGPPGTMVKFSGTGFTPNGGVTVALIPGFGIVVAQVTADPDGGITGSFFMPTPAAELNFGPVGVFGIDQSSGQQSNPVTFILTRPAIPMTAFFFAEGATTPPFDTWFLIQNPGAVVANVTFTFQLLGGGTNVRRFVVGPNSRFSIFANQILPNQAFSTFIDSDQIIFAERAMYVSFDGSDVTEIRGESPIWLFAEGATVQPFHTWLLLQNTNAQTVTATITYLLEGGGTMTQTASLPATSRTSIFVNEVLPNAAFSTRVVADLPIIVERSMFRFPGNAATAVAGVQSASLTWFFAEGRKVVRPFTDDLPTDTWLLLQNPNNTSVSVTVTFFDAAAGTSTFTQVLPPLSRRSIFMNNFTTLSSFAFRVEASAPIIAERSMFIGTEPKGATATVGSPDLATVWNFAEGSTAPPFTETISVLNPNAQEMNVTMDFFLQNGQVVTRQFTTGPNSKLSVLVDSIIPSAANSARVTTSLPSVAERTMYFLKSGNVGAHGKIGMR